jgi:hypothetical protein
MGLYHLTNSRTQRFFLSMFADSIRVVNQKRDSSGLTFARKAMIRCGLALAVGGAWCVAQLLSELQEIIRQHPREIAGEESSWESESGEESDIVMAFDEIDKMHE